jgi:MSHA pilin protein MshA
MNNMQKGFTLIELVVVIVILGILAATALPKFVDLTGDATNAAVKGYAGAISSGNNINYATYLARRTVTDLTVATTQVANTSSSPCSLAVVNTLLSAQSQLAVPYAVSGGSTSLGAGVDVTCALSTTGSTSQNFVVTGAK